MLKLSSQTINVTGRSKSTHQNVDGDTHPPHHQEQDTPKCGDQSCDGDSNHPHFEFPTGSTQQQTVMSQSKNKNEDDNKSLTHTLYVQAKTVVNILGESMKRYLLPSSYFSPKREKSDSPTK